MGRGIPRSSSSSMSKETKPQRLVQEAYIKEHKVPWGRTGQALSTQSGESVRDGIHMGL